MERYFRKVVKKLLPESAVWKIRQWEFKKTALNFTPYTIRTGLEETEFDFLIADTCGKKWYDKEKVGNAHEMCFIRDKMIEPGDIVFECGAHHGFTTLLLGKWVGKRGEVFAFEASKHNFSVLQRNIEINAMKNIHAFQSAVGNEKGRINISLEYNASVLKEKGGDTVEMVCLDEFKATSPDFVKIDVEGFEIGVLKGAREILANRPKLAMEIHTEWLDRYGSSIGEIFEHVDIKSYDFWVQWTDERYPQRYRNEPISTRVHLFCLPK